MADPARFELTTSALGGQRSIQLSYGSGARNIPEGPRRRGVWPGDAAYGPGNGSTTFNLPDLRGHVAAGKDDMGGSAAGRVTTACGIAGTTLGATGGVQINNAVTSIVGSASGVVSGDVAVSAAVGGTPIFAAGGAGAATGYDHNHTASFNVPALLTVNGIGTSSAFSTTQPTIILNYLIRI